MAIDGVLLNSIVRELEEKLMGGRVDKVYQPEIDEIHMIIRNKSSNYKLLLSASPNHPRIHLTKINKDNPSIPPNFCMVLRKHLTGGRVLFINQPNFERIIEISIESPDEMGDLSRKKLIIEIMGRHSNIILSDAKDNIIDSIKHITNNISRVREVLPGIKYTYPPSHGKIDPRCATKEKVATYLKSLDGSTKPENAITNAYNGISKITAKEIIHMVSNNTDIVTLNDSYITKIGDSFVNFFDIIQKQSFKPVLIVDSEDTPIDILPFVYNVCSSMSIKVYQTISEAMDDFFIKSDRAERSRQKTAYLRKILKNNLDRCYKKLAVLKDDVKKAKNADIYRLYGELITANIYNIQSGTENISLQNYYDPDNGNIVIPLDKDKSPAQNAQSYFKKYNKAKTVIDKQGKLIINTEDEIKYLDSLNEHLNMVSAIEDIIGIKEELIKSGYIKEKSKNKRKPGSKSSPHHFISSDGFDIFVGKNNLQNDYLTLRLAVNSDVWLHTKDIPGSHVIVKNGGRAIPESTLIEAATLAAYFSKGRDSSNVPVDYCPKKNVKKPSGAKPGMVIYDRYNTIYVTPTENVVNSISI